MAELDTVGSKMKSTVDKLMDSNLSIHMKRNIEKEKYVNEFCLLF